MRALILLFFVLFSSRLGNADELVMISPHWEGIRKEFSRAFSKKWQEQTGHPLEVRYLDVGGTSDIIKYVRAQFGLAAEGIGVDLIFGGGTDPFVELTNDGYLVPYLVSQKILDAIPPDIGGIPLYDADYHWYAAALSASGILYNRAVLSKLHLPEPTEWEDLSNPLYFTWVAAADPRKSGSMHMMYELILQAYGWDAGWRIIFGLAKNARTFGAFAQQVGKDVATGDVAVGFVNDTYAGELIRRFGEDRIGYVVPRKIASLVGDSFAILKGAPHRDIAQAFMEFVLSEEGQKIWSLKRGELGGPHEFELGKLPLLPSLYNAPGHSSSIQGNPFEWTFGSAYDPKLGGKRWNIVNDLFGAFIIDVHDRIVTQPSQDTSPPPISEPELFEFLDKKTMSDSASRSRLLRDWSIAARSRFPQKEDRAKDIVSFVCLATLCFFGGLIIIKNLSRKFRRRRLNV